MDPFLGQIQIFGFNFSPQGWVFCNGQIMSIAQNTALFALLGTAYGGNGSTTFGLPDLRGRMPIHPGQGPGLSPISQGQVSGTETRTLITSNLPAHSHAMTATNSDANSDEPLSGSRLGVSNANIYASAGTPNVVMAADTTTNTGNNIPFNIRNPYLGVFYSIAMQGIFPSRN